MNPAPHRSDVGQTGWLILGLVAIPFLSVSSVALVADVASTTNPAAAAAGIPAVLGGVVVGALVFRLARVVHSGAVAICGALLRTFEHEIAAVSETASRVSLVPVVQPAIVFVPAPTGRRGPPSSSQ